MNEESGDAAPRKSRLVPFALSALCVVALVVWLISSGAMDFRPDTAKIRGVTEDFIEACRDRDFDEIWDLHSEAWQGKGMDAAKREMDRAGVAYPEDLDQDELFLHLLEDWTQGEPTLETLPWLWPPEWLDDLRIGEVTVGPTDSFLKRKGQAEVILTFAKQRYGSLEPQDIRLIFVKAGRKWRIDFMEIRAWVAQDDATPIPDVRAEQGADGRSLLVLRIGFAGVELRPETVGNSLAPVADDTVVRLEVAEDVDLAALAPWLRAVAEAGRSEVVLRPCRQPPRKKGVWMWVQALYIGSVRDATEPAFRDLRIEIPNAAPETVLALPVAAGAPPARPAKEVLGEMRFLPDLEEAEPLRERFVAATEGEDPPTPLLAPEAETSIWKLGAVWRVVRDHEPIPVLLALPGPGSAESRILLRK